MWGKGIVDEDSHAEININGRDFSCTEILLSYGSDLCLLIWRIQASINISGEHFYSKLFYVHRRRY